MFSIPFFALLVAYLIFLAVFVIFSIANVYHLYHTGTFTFAAVTVTILTTVWVLLVLGATIPVIMSVDWNTSVVFMGNGGFVTFEQYAP